MKSLKNTRYMQYVAAISATAAVTSSTMYVTWPSPTLTSLTGPNSPIGVTLTDEEASWMISILLLAAIPVSPFLAILVDKIGRRRTLLLSAFFTFFPWFLIIFADAVWMLFVARFFGGIGMAIASSISPIYTGEISDKDIRGKLTNTFHMMKLTGTFIVLSAGPFVSYTVLGIISAVVPVLFFCSFYFMPESPYQLVRVGKRDEAKKALITFSSDSVDEKEIEKKLEEIKSTIDSDMQNKMGFVEFYTKKEYRKLIFILLGVKTLQQMSGAIAMEGYLQSIVEQSGSSIPADISSIIFGAVQFPAVIVASAVVDRLGRRPILLTSAIGSCISLFAEGLYFYLKDSTDVDTSKFSWLPTTALVGFLVLSSFGIQSIPYVLLSELFPTNIKGVAVTSATTYGAAMAFIASKIFDPVTQAWGDCAIFWLYAGFCFAGAVFVYFFLIETKGKSFDEIQYELNGRKGDLESK